jgi:hypothetical protein
MGLRRPGARLEGSRDRPDGRARARGSAGRDDLSGIGWPGKSRATRRLRLLPWWSARAHGGPGARGDPGDRRLPRLRVPPCGCAARRRAVRPRRGRERPHAGPARDGGRAGPHRGHASDGGADAGPRQGLHLRVLRGGPPRLRSAQPIPAMPSQRPRRASARPDASWRHMCPSADSIGNVHGAGTRARGDGHAWRRTDGSRSG